MVTEMGFGWLADISRFVLEHGHENILPFAHLHTEASRSGQPLNSQPNVPDMLRHIRDRRDDIGAQRSHVPQPQQALQQPPGQYSCGPSERHSSPGYEYPVYNYNNQVRLSSANIAAGSRNVAHAWPAFGLAAALIA